MHTDTTEESRTRAEQARARLQKSLERSEDAEASAESGEPTDRRRKSGLPRGRRTRAAVVVVLVAVLACTGGLLRLHAGRSVFGLQAGESVLSFLPTWLPDDVAFQFGDRDVTENELNTQVDTLRALYGVQVPADPAQLATFRRDSAKAYAVTLVLDRAAADNGIVIADKTARETLARFVQEKLGNGADAYTKFVTALGEQGTTEQAVLDELKRRLAMAQLFDKVTAGGSSVTDQDVETAFAQRRGELGTPEKRQISNLVVGSREEADRALAAVRSGAPFDSEARQVSLDGSTRENGGDLGAVTRDQLDRPFGDAAFTAQPGQPFGPVQTSYGWNVGIVGQVQAPVPAEFAQVKEPLRQQLQAEHALDGWRGWLTHQITAAEVRYADAYRPAVPDAAPGGGPAKNGLPDGMGGR